MATQTDFRRDMRVLVVEDEALIAEELQDRLALMGMTVVGAVDSYNAALEHVARTRPNLVLLDIQLRGALDGIDLAAVIYGQMGIPVVFLTAHSDEVTLERAKRTAPFGYVLKPFRERDLLVAIDMALYRHGLEQRLKASERKYVATLTSIGDGVVATDLNGEITFMNPVAEALTGWTLANARGLPAEEVFRVSHDPGGHTFLNPIEQAMQQRQVLHFEGPDLFLISRNNEAIPIDDSVAPVVDERGEISGGVVAFRDIRHRRLAEDALRKAQDELFQAQKMESVGRLSAGLAHDFNNLLTVINGCTELALLSDCLDDTVRTLLDSVLKAGTRATSITRQFLAFGRKQVMRPRVMDVNVLVRDLEAILIRLIGEHIRLTTLLHSAPVLVMADATQIEQAVVNLVINARDAMPDGGILTIATSKSRIGESVPDIRPEIAPGAYAVVSVADTGSGIEETIKHKIFEPYFTTKEFGKGSGLGLASVFGVVKQFDGFIDVDSEPGSGATFRVYLPLVEDCEPESDDAQAGPPPVVRGRETILLVEDEPFVRSFVGSVLRRTGYTVLEAGVPAEAIRLFESHDGPVDLVVTDVVMPDMQGPALVARLTELKSSLRVLYMSAYTSDSAPVTLSGAFIQKPFTPAALAQRVRHLLDN